MNILRAQKQLKVKKLGQNTYHWLYKTSLIICIYLHISLMIFCFIKFNGHIGYFPTVSLSVQNMYHLWRQPIHYLILKLEFIPWSPDNETGKRLEGKPAWRELFHFKSLTSAPRSCKRWEKLQTIWYGARSSCLEHKMRNGAPKP